MRGAVGLLTGCAAVLVLAGCASAPAPVAPESPALPSSFPSSVPLGGGRIVAAESSGRTWKVWVRSSSVVEDYRAAMRRIVAAGFSTTYDNVQPGSGQGQFCDRRLCVDLNAYDDPDHGRSLGYEVYRNTGLGAPG